MPPLSAPLALAMKPQQLPTMELILNKPEPMEEGVLQQIQGTMAITETRSIELRPTVTTNKLIFRWVETT